MAKNKGTQQQGKQTVHPDKKSEMSRQSSLAQSRRNQETGLSRRTGASGVFINPFSLMRRLGTDMEQLFDEFGFGGITPRGFDQMAAWTPQVEMLQREGELVVRADLPGLNKDNVKVELRDDAIVLQGERREERNEESEGFLRTERSYGSFYREIPLPQGIDTTKARATFHDGVLEITMPSTQVQTQGRQLEIKDSQPESQQKAQARSAGSGR